MIIWLNGAFGAGKTTVACELECRLTGAYLYDPENIGYFLRKNTPHQCHTLDFQDTPLWRSFNYEALKMIAGNYPGTIIVPMTLVNRTYYEEIIGKLQVDGIEVKHFILYASRETILKRLRMRNLGLSILQRESFAVNAIPRCLDFFDQQVTEVKLQTDKMSVDEVVEAVAAQSGLILRPDSRSKVQNIFYRLGILLDHIRR